MPLNCWGERLIEDRKIKIGEYPFSNHGSPVRSSSSSSDVILSAVRKPDEDLIMRGDHDEHRLRRLEEKVG